MPQDLKSVTQLWDAAAAFLVTYSMQILASLLLLIVGWKVSNWIATRIEKFAIAKGIDVTLSKFMASGLRLVLIALLVIVTLGNFGITITPLIAMIGAAAFGITVAIKGPLANFGAGFAIILTRPFVIGNTVTIRGMTGVVEDIRLGATFLTSHDGERITIPNSKVVGEILVNTRQHELVQTKVAVDYGSDVDKITNLIREVLRGFPQVPQDLAPEIGVLEFGPTGLVVAYRYRVPSRQLYDTQFAVNNAVIGALRGAGIDFRPYYKADLAGAKSA